LQHTYFGASVRIDQARRAAVRNGVVGDGMFPESADAWIAAREAPAAQDGTDSCSRPRAMQMSAAVDQPRI
jgi:hypothetical protein